MSKFTNGKTVSYGKTNLYAADKSIVGKRSAEFTKDAEGYTKGMNEDPYQGARGMRVMPDWFSNPNPQEHVEGWPLQKMENRQDSNEKFMIVGLFVALILIAFLKAA